MDVKQYYRKLREIESSINESYVVVVSLETPDGGRPGLLSEVPRSIAAKMVIEGRAKLGTDAEQKAHREQQRAAKLIAEKNELAKKIQLTLVSDQNLQAALGKRELSDSKKIEG